MQDRVPNPLWKSNQALPSNGCGVRSVVGVSRVVMAACAGACLFLGGFFPVLSVHAAHAYAQFGDIKYPEGFSHWSYVNPDAPKGGRLTLVPPTRLSNFDKYNPFTLKGNAAPGLSGLLFDTLLSGNMDEPATAYGLLAQDVQVAKDRRSVTFELRPQARFHDGSEVLAVDVKATFDRLMSSAAAPQYRTLLSDVARVVVLGPRTVRFEFQRANAELPLIVGGLPIFSHRWGADKPFDQVVAEQPIGSGPYRIGRVNFGKDITYQLDPSYWARDLNVRKGQFNFAELTYKIYQDNTAQLEAFKAGEFDYIQAFIAREWARAYQGRPFNDGTLVKREIHHGNAGDFQGFLFNLRRPKFQDVRVRQAIALAMDFEWMNRQLFFNAYTRVRGYFVGSDFEATGKPVGEEHRLLQAWKTALPPELFDQPVPLDPKTSLDVASGETLRDHLRRARDLLAAAGWTYHDGALRNARGEPFVLEFLDSSGSMGRVVTPYAKNLEKLGFAVRYKVVDFALLQKRLDVFDFDLISNRIVGSETPGTELLDRFGSKAADVEGSSNLMGIKSPVVDGLIDQIVQSQTRDQLVPRVRALDRVLRFGHYTVPHWYSSSFRVAYRAGVLVQPAETPRYFQPESWLTTVWWASATNLAQVHASQPRSDKGAP